MTISLGSLGSLSGSGSSSSVPDFRSRLSLKQTEGRAVTESSASDVAYSTRALSSTSDAIDSKSNALDSLLNEVSKLIDIAEEIQNGRYDEHTLTLRAEGAARVTAAIAAYERAAGINTNLDNSEGHRSNTAIKYDPTDTEDAVYVTISAVSSPEDLGVTESIFDVDGDPIEDTIETLENAKAQLELERTALGSTGTAVSAADEKAQIRAEAIEVSQNTEAPSDPSDVVKEQAEQVLADGSGSVASLASELTSLIDDASEAEVGTEDEEVEEEDDEEL